MLSVQFMLDVCTVTALQRPSEASSWLALVSVTSNCYPEQELETLEFTHHLFL